ncbi:DDE-type integrase/transposase/recombinase [Pelotomaculum isophthalicicum JI]|uniref:DDE-type integrase/transposase/recombinase n=1 Tax=Pelotomaculum isophthalicicum JI TaxID=947010 RepID=A0A9X4H5H4_9FIRM|nr:DDE-type integrase/transposase/recombinase [Pelotomaculum isophthalicicum]MDF9408138.1 DDE-type integrase/transposase/recombinase [Pelotomaculum isophthalicicum JI]
MKEPSDDRRLLVAMQRFEIIAPLLNRPLPRGVQKTILEELAGKMHLNAENRLITLGKRTIERYLSNYLKFGLDGLKPKVRPEQGVLKAFPPGALDEAVNIRLARPELSADSIIEELRSAKVPGAQQMSVSTLNRHLRRLGKDRPALKRTVRKRYRLLSVEGAHVLWICDVWDGPYLTDELTGRKRRLRLVAIIDSYSRYIVHAEFYFNENRPCIEDTLMKAILKHNLPEVFYCDNAKVFRSRHMKRIAAELGFSVKHSRPGIPQGRGRIERWFRTVAEKCEPLLKEQINSGKVTTLYEVNNFFAAWLERRYHSRRHSTLKMSPREFLENAGGSHLDMSRHVDPATVHEAFLWRENRGVSPLGAVRLQGNLYEVDESLLGKTVELRFNPYDLRRILVYCEGTYRCEARPYQMKNFTEKRVQERQTDSRNALDKAMQAIVQEHREEIKERSGLSFAKAMGVKHGE